MACPRSPGAEQHQRAAAPGWRKNNRATCLPRRTTTWLAAPQSSITWATQAIVHTQK